MSHNTPKQGVLFKSLSKKAVIARFHQDHASSDGGAVSLKTCNEKLNLSTTLASCLLDDRQQSKVTHSPEALFQQRLFAIACGYTERNDAARLADDPAMKLLSGRNPITRDSLASQLTLSRFGNATRAVDLLCLSEALADAVIARHKRRNKRVWRITIDVDPTDDPTHGAQQLALFNRFYDTSCYLPMAGFRTSNKSDKEAEQYLFCCVLRAGEVAARHGATYVLKRLLPRLCQFQSKIAHFEGKRAAG